MRSLIANNLLQADKSFDVSELKAMGNVGAEVKSNLHGDWREICHGVELHTYIIVIIEFQSESFTFQRDNVLQHWTSF